MPLENFHFTVPIFLSALLYGRVSIEEEYFAVCDLEVDYALNFMDYLNHKKISHLRFAFTNVESLIAYGKMNHIELLADLAGYVPSQELKW